MQHVKMNLLLIILSTITSIINGTVRCRLDCSCLDDDSCEYYCESNHCRGALYPGSKCQGQHIHPRECGSEFCDPRSNYTCQFRKLNGGICLNDYACHSEYCDLTLQTCQDKPKDSSSSKLIPILIGSIAAPIVLMTILSIICVYVKKRQRNSLPEPVYLFIATIQVRTEENDPAIQESLPPSYAESVPVSPNTTINNVSNEN